jgi:hypothetical protein
VHPLIQSAVAAQHVKDMLDHAAEEGRVREARRARRGRRRARRHASLGAQTLATRREPAPAQCAAE